MVKITLMSFNFYHHFVFSSYIHLNLIYHNYLFERTDAFRRLKANSSLYRYDSGGVPARAAHYNG